MYTKHLPRGEKNCYMRTYILDCSMYFHCLCWRFLIPLLSDEIRSPLPLSSPSFTHPTQPRTLKPKSPKPCPAHTERERERERASDGNGGDGRWGTSRTPKEIETNPDPRLTRRQAAKWPATMVGATTTDGDGWASPGDLARARRTEQQATATYTRNPSPTSTRIQPSSWVL